MLVSNTANTGFPYGKTWSDVAKVVLADHAIAAPTVKYLTNDQKRDLIAQIRREMVDASENLDFAHAAEPHYSIKQLEVEVNCVHNKLGA